jgi:hypothetical protein
VSRKSGETSAFAPRAEVFQKLLAEDVGANFADQLNWIPEARNRDGLVRSLATRMDLKVRPGDRLACLGDMLGIRNKIDIDTAYDNDRFTLWWHVRTFLVRSR